MTNAELIKALRRCSYTTVAGADREDGYCKPCAYFAEDTSDITCIDRMMIDAADALEAAEHRIEDLEGALAACRIRKDGRIPKEGEWLRTDAFPHRVYCSCCYKTYVPNENWQIWQDDADNFGLPRNYCPNCGAKMKTVTDCHTLEEGEHDGET